MTLANRITILRILLVPLFIALILYSKEMLAFFVFLIAAVSDMLDGYIARITKQKTELGKILDPIADKILVLSAFICLSVIHSPMNFPRYVPIIIISRDAIIVLGIFLIYFLKGNIKINPTLLGKSTTFFQMITIVSVLLKFDFSPYLWNLAVIFTILSGINYVMIGMRLLNDK
jgi:cardiolipin synthase (CMP-forming)